MGKLRANQPGYKKNHKTRMVEQYGCHQKKTSQVVVILVT